MADMGGCSRRQTTKRGKDKTLKLRILTALAVPVALTGALALGTLHPSTARASTTRPAATSAYAGTATARTLTNCDSWHVFYGGQAEWTVCLTSNDWFNGYQVATNWDSPSCSVLWIERYAWSCQGYNYGHYWNAQIGANTDWLHERIGLTGTITSECANLNLNTKANGYTWTSDNIYPVLPWQSC
jgi:hypothetical protein